MAESMPHKRIVPVLTEVIDDGRLVRPPVPPLQEQRGPVPAAAEEPLIDLSDASLQLEPAAVRAAIGMLPDLEPIECRPAAPVPLEHSVDAGEAGFDDDSLRQLIAQAIERAKPSLVEQLLPELRQQLQALLEERQGRAGRSGD